MGQVQPSLSVRRRGGLASTHSDPCRQVRRRRAHLLCACPAPACSASTPDCCCHCWSWCCWCCCRCWCCAAVAVCCCHLLRRQPQRLDETRRTAAACLRRVLVLVLCLALPCPTLPLLLPSPPLPHYHHFPSFPSPAVSLTSLVCIDAHPPASATAHNLGALGLDAATAVALTPPSITHQRAAAGELSTYCCCCCYYCYCCRRCCALALALHPSPKPHSSCWLHAGPALIHSPLSPQPACSRPRTHSLDLTHIDYPLSSSLRPVIFTARLWCLSLAYSTPVPVPPPAVCRITPVRVLHECCSSLHLCGTAPPCLEPTAPPACQPASASLTLCASP